MSTVRVCVDKEVSDQCKELWVRNLLYLFSYKIK